MLPLGFGSPVFTDGKTLTSPFTSLTHCQNTPDGGLSGLWSSRASFQNAEVGEELMRRNCNPPHILGSWVVGPGFYLLKVRLIFTKKYPAER